jgi:hypothetical protein
VQFAVQPPVIVVLPLTVIPLVRLTPVIQMNVPAGNVIVSPSCAFVSWIACTFASEPSDGQTVPKELDVTKKDSPVAIQRNLPIFSPFFCWPFFDFLLIGLPARESTRRKRRSPGREEGCHYDSSILAVFYLVRTRLNKVGQYVKPKTS